MRTGADEPGRTRMVDHSQQVREAGSWTAPPGSRRPPL